MGTRASFFIGNPQDMEARVWLGCVAFDGYPDGDIGETLRDKKTHEDFRKAVDQIACKRRDFTDPKTHNFPFPWKDDLFLTDFTYALIDGEVQATSFHSGFAPLSEHLEAAAKSDLDWFDRYKSKDDLPRDVPAPIRSDKPLGPDSIIRVQI